MKIIITLRTERIFKYERERERIDRYRVLLQVGQAAIFTIERVPRECKIFRLPVNSNIIEDDLMRIIISCLVNASNFLVGLNKEINYSTIDFQTHSVHSNNIKFL